MPTCLFYTFYSALSPCHVALLGFSDSVPPSHLHKPLSTPRSVLSTCGWLTREQSVQLLPRGACPSLSAAFLVPQSGARPRGASGHRGPLPPASPLGLPSPSPSCLSPQVPSLLRSPLPSGCLSETAVLIFPSGSF